MCRQVLPSILIPPPQKKTPPLLFIVNGGKYSDSWLLKTLRGDYWMFIPMYDIYFASCKTQETSGKQGARKGDGNEMGYKVLTSCHNTAVAIENS